MRVCIVGTGYVGLITGVCLSYLGHHVTCVDQNGARIDQMANGRPPMFEPGLQSLLAFCLDQGTLRFTTDLEEGLRLVEVVFVTVGTSPLPSGEPDFQSVADAARAIGAHVPSEAPFVIAIKSTVPIGASQWVSSLVEEGRQASPAPVGRQVFAESPLTPPPRVSVVVNPDFLREGTAIVDTLYPDRIVVGADDPAALDVMRELYAPILRQDFPAPEEASRPVGVSSSPLLATDLQSAEMIKCVANAFLATKISFANEMAALCEKVGADIVEVARGIGLDSRIGPRNLDAGIGWGGNRYDKSIGALVSIAQEYGCETRILAATVAINRAQRHRIVQKLQEKLKVIKGRTIGLLGIALKPGTDDLRDVPGIEISRMLIRMGARVKLYDPVAMPACREQFPDLDVAYAEDPVDLASGSDALVVVTEWDEFRCLDLPRLRVAMRTPILVDARNVYLPAAASAAGFSYVGVGR